MMPAPRLHCCQGNDAAAGCHRQTQTFGLLQIPQLDGATLGTSYNNFLCVIKGDTLHWALMSRQALQYILACQSHVSVALAQ